MGNVEHVFIVGAGFSKHAGLPLTNEFTRELLNVDSFKEAAPSRRIVEYLQFFVSEVFGQRYGDPDLWPDLEDIFTCVDLAANTGHHLGQQFSPSALRTVRRALIVRIIRMLRQAYVRRPKEVPAAWESLTDFLTRLNLRRSAFISMNWDTVVEAGLASARNCSQFDYCCEALRARFNDSRYLKLEAVAGDSVPIVKMHGSSNWVYCDVCRQLFWVSPEMVVSVADLLFKESDWRQVGDVLDEDQRGPYTAKTCPYCDSDALGTRIATFSYRKALEFPMYERSWLAAERILREAKSWVFIGYSLPAADYQFKHLLKHVELSRSERPEIVLISGGLGAKTTLKNFQKFFGSLAVSEQRNYYSNGLCADSMARLKTLGALD